ncbi:MAG: hypothetical protein ACXWXQ_06265, partial [Actinomycetota bacterium]
MKVVTIGGVMYEDPGDGWLVAVAEESNGSSASSASSAPAAPWLDPSSAALRGLAGDVVRAVEPHTEADPAGLLFVLLAHIGAMVGNRTEARAGATRHPPTLFVVLAGRSSHSRKDTAAREIEAICDRVDDGWAQTHRLGGFGSGEAIVATAAEHPGEPLYISESEFARLLAVGSRDGSTVSPVLRACWDFRRIQYRTRKDTFDAPAAPVALVGHITADELLDSRTGLRP